MKIKSHLAYLERARNLSFNTSSKEVAAYCDAFLARAYATFGDEKRFMQAINTAITLADNMRERNKTSSGIEWERSIKCLQQRKRSDSH